MKTSQGKARLDNVGGFEMVTLAVKQLQHNRKIPGSYTGKVRRQFLCNNYACSAFSAHDL